MDIHSIHARDLPDLWFQAVHDILDHGRRFVIDRECYELPETRDPVNPWLEWCGCPFFFFLKLKWVSGVRIWLGAVSDPSILTPEH